MLAISLRAGWLSCSIVHTLISAELPCRNLSYYCLLALLILWCYFSRTSCWWWITQSTQHHRRGCNNIPSFLQRTTQIARSLCEGLNSARPPHPGHSTILMRLETPSGMCANLRTVAASNNRDHARNLSSHRLVIMFNRSHVNIGRATTSQSVLLLLARATYIMVLFFTHILLVVKHTTNATPPERLQQYKRNFCGQQTMNKIHFLKEKNLLILALNI